MKQIQQIYSIQAPLNKVWDSLTTTELAEAWGAGVAQVDAREGGIFSYWGGDIHGLYTKLVHHKLIEQDWYGHDNPTWKYSVRFVFEYDGFMTTIHMTYSGEIVDEHRDIADWRDYYFEPIRKLLEQ